VGRQYKIDIAVEGWDEAVAQIKAVEVAGDKMATSLDTKNAAAVRRWGDAVRQSVSASEAQLFLFGRELDAGANRWTSYGTAARAGLNSAAEAAGITTASLGLLSSATLLVTAAMGGWQIGRAIAELLDLDRKVAETTARLRGLGDVQAQVFGAQQDAITRAIERGASSQITYGEAVEFNTRWLLQWQAAWGDLGALRERMDAPAESARRIRAWNDELSKIAQAGVLNSLRKDIQSHLFSMAELSERYHISTEALGMYSRSITAQEQRFRQLDQEQKRFALETKRAAEIIDDAYAYMAKSAIRNMGILRDQTRQAQAELTAAIAGQMLDNLGARERNLRRQGMDRSGNMLPGNDPIAQMQAAQTEYDQGLRNLRETARPGVDISALEEELFNVFQDKFAAAAEAANQLAMAHTEAAGTGRLAAGGMDVAGRASYSAAEAFASFRGMLLPGSTGNWRAASAAAVDARSVGLGGVGMLPTGALTVGTLGSSGPGPVNFQNARAPGVTFNAPLVDARGAWFENDRAVNDLAARVQDRISSAFVRNR